MSDETVFVAPELPARKFAYLTGGLDDVQGWLIPSTALYLAGLEQAQRGIVQGGICEIGVHRGKSFLAMAIDAPSSDAKVAIDVFDLQHLNEDGTSSEALLDFRRNLERWEVDDVEVVEGSSLELEADGFLEAGKRFRLFSVDGGHGSEYVLNDLRLAEATIVDGGVVAADDVFNVHWLGVCTGTFEYFHSGGSLRPFALIPNKLLLTNASSLEANRAMLRDLYPAGLTKADVPLLDTTIDVYGDIDWSLTSGELPQAKLQRDPAAVATLRAKLAGAELELARVRQELRRAESHKRDLHRKLQKLRQAPSQPREASPGSSPTPNSDSAHGRIATTFRRHAPEFLKRPARTIYRTLR